MRNLSLLVAVAFLVTLGGLGPATHVAASSPMIFEVPQQPLTQDMPLYITFKHSYFNDSVLVYLANNASKCEVGSVYSDTWPSQSPASNRMISGIQQWTRHDPSQDWRVRFTTPSPELVSTVYVCYSLNKGLTYLQAENSMGRPYFKLWEGLPTATLEPHTALVRRPLYIHVKNIPHYSKLALVTTEAACRAGSHITVNATADTYGGFSFAVEPTNTGYYYVCLSGPNYDHWNIVPVDQGQILTHNIGAGGAGPTHRLPLDGVGFWVYPYEVSQHLATIKCGTIIAGAEVNCEIMMNETIAANVVATDLTFDSLTDGAGIEECPFPPIRPAGAAGLFNFQWVPQHYGRAGTLKLRYKGAPLFIKENALSQQYYARVVPNTTYSHVFTSDTNPSSTRDQGTMNFFIEPEFSFIQQFNYHNYFNVDYMTSAVGSHVWTEGVPIIFGGTQNGTRDKEMRTVTMASGINTGKLTETVELPPGARDCVVSVHYYFTGTLIDEFTTVPIGRFLVTPQTAGGVDLSPLQDYTIWSSLRRTQIQGSSRARVLDGDVNTWEQLVRHFSVLSTHKTIKMELEIDHTKAKELYYANTKLQCVTTVPFTHPDDARSLKELYAALGGPTSLITNWEKAGVWNGDPCKDHWQGVKCRHFRVVGVNLAHRKLTGVLPFGLSRMARLETLDLSDNTLHEMIPDDFKNMTRLKELDLSQNRLTDIASVNVFSFPHQQCVTSIQLHHNLLTAFPGQALNLPKLQRLDLHSNLMVNTIPDMDVLDSKLEHFDVRDNILTGSLPKLRSRTIKSADFSANQFAGSVPAQWGDLQEARFLDVSGNQLDGVIPGALTKIRTAATMVFNSVGNRHTGFMPHLPFSRVDVRGNLFRCPLPYDYAWIVNPIVGLEDEMQCDWYDPDTANEE